MSELALSQLEQSSNEPLGVVLHHQTMQIPEGQVLRDLGSTRALGINGVTVVELELPSPVTLGSNIMKKVALIDFGTDIPAEGKAVLYNPDIGQELPIYKVTETDRFALVGINYRSSESLAQILTLPKGLPRTFGGMDFDPNSHRLGLTSRDRDLSESHATVTVYGVGNITIADHSTNGIKVILRS